MKRYNVFSMVCILVFSLLTGCATQGYYYKGRVENHYVQEHWMQRVNLKTDAWTQRADSWFFSSDPGDFDDYSKHIPASRAMSATMIRAQDFTNIVVDGPYKVQVFGHQEHNSLYVLGPNTASRHTVAEVRGNTLFIHPATDCQSSCTNIGEVIVRVGVRDLTHLTAGGGSFVEGKDISSGGLFVKSTNGATILLKGNMNLVNVLQMGTGTISVLGAYSPNMNLTVLSDGNVNISGRVGIRCITKQGRGNVNIIGADTDSLKIESGGGGTTSVAGYANLKNVNVFGHSRVLLYWVNSTGMRVTVHDQACLGLAGSVGNLEVEMDGASTFQGKYLRAENIYIRTRNQSHANINPAQKMFATAMDDSSIYFFSAPNVASRYTSEHGVILPIWCDACGANVMPHPPIAHQQRVYKSVYKT